MGGRPLVMASVPAIGSQQLSYLCMNQADASTCTDTDMAQGYATSSQAWLGVDEGREPHSDRNSVFLWWASGYDKNFRNYLSHE